MPVPFPGYPGAGFRQEQPPPPGALPVQAPMMQQPMSMQQQPPPPGSMGSPQQQIHMGQMPPPMGKPPPSAHKRRFTEHADPEEGFTVREFSISENIKAIWQVTEELSSYL
jgi:hypothetical protein